MGCDEGMGRDEESFDQDRGTHATSGGRALPSLWFS